MALNKLELLRIFCTAAELANFKAAAVKLAVSPQAVTRAVQQLEQLTGELLFHRNTRQVRLTQFGEQLYTDGQQQLAQLEKLFSPRLASEDIQGLVRLAAPAAFQPVLSPLLLEFAAMQPQIRLDVRLSDQHSDVVDEQIDLGIRAGLLRDQSFVAVQVSEVALWLVASPEYLETHGAPKALADFPQHPNISLLDAETGRPWAWFFRDGEIYQPRQVRLLVNDAQQEITAVAAGLGIGQVAD
ncbi:MAG: LysR family transcriptional regulator, partial [Gammaproteobacteria bacterium]|nr:LysR family transcriptional regulator [Gammaproteobacteria bacterium]